MQAYSLHEIEKTMRLLWMDRRSRQRFLDGKKDRKKAGSCAIDEVPAELLEKIDSKGVRLYAGLIKYGHHELMDSVYPGCARLIDSKWDDVVDDYYERYPATHYNLNQASRHFPEYLGKYGQRYLKKYPFLVELADYEWIELELMEKDSQIEVFPYAPLADPQQFANQAPAVNPVLLIRHYQYPITTIVDHLQAECCLPDVESRPVTVVVYRDPETHMCRFLETTPVTTRLIEQASLQLTSYKDLLQLALSLSAGISSQQAAVEFLELIEKLQIVRLLSAQVPLLSLPIRLWAEVSLWFPITGAAAPWARM